MGVSLISIGWEQQQTPAGDGNASGAHTAAVAAAPGGHRAVGAQRGNVPPAPALFLSLGTEAVWV